MELRTCLSISVNWSKCRTIYAEQFLEFMEKNNEKRRQFRIRQRAIHGTIMEMSEGEVQILIDDF